jgi:adenylate cyclase
VSLFNELKRRNVIRVGTAYIVLAWLVIQVVETVFPAFGFDEAPVRIAATLGLLGFIPTLIFAWAFELTPEGVRKESEVVRSESITRHTGKLLDRTILLILTVSLLYFTIDKFILAEHREASIAESAREEGRFGALGISKGTPSIAVLPFADMSAKGDQEYFGDGISEELLNLLAKIPELRVISRTSAFSFKGQDLEITEIAERLNVGHILEGSVRMAGKQVRITAQLIETSTDSHLWSETYDRDMENIFVIQDEIAAAVVQELEVRLLAASSSETSSEAYRLYLQAGHFSDQLSAESLEKSLDLLTRVLKMDENYANAWISLSTVYDRMSTLQVMDPEKARGLSASAALKAMEIAPDFAATNDLMAWIVLRDDGDLEKAAAYYQKALELEPTNIAAIANSALFLGLLGREAGALELCKYHVSRDPANSVAYNNLGMQYRFAGQYKKADEAFLTAIALSPGSYGANYEITLSKLLQGDISGAERAIAAESSEVFRQLGTAMVLYAKGQEAESARVSQELIIDYGAQLGYYIGQLMAYRGMPDEAFYWLNAAYMAGDGEVKAGMREPMLSSLHGDPRWARLLAKMERLPEQLDAIEFYVTPPPQGVKTQHI